MTPKNPPDTNRSSEVGPSAEWLDVVREKISRLRFGSVQITVHDGRVTQVESIERTRFATGGEKSR